MMPRALPGLGIVEDAGEAAAQFDRGRQLTALLVDGMAAASSSDTENMPGAWDRRAGLSKRYIGYLRAADVSCLAASPLASLGSE